MTDHKLLELINPKVHTEQKKPYSGFIKLQNFIAELSGRALPDAVVVKINEQITQTNEQAEHYKVWKKQLSKSLASILQILEKQMNLVPKNHYRNQWMALGMSIFGIPMGVVFGVMLDNMAFLGLGLPIGMTIGIAVGSQKDKQAAAEGRQLNFDVG